jgi:hypothetical protein
MESKANARAVSWVAVSMIAGAAWMVVPTGCSKDSTDKPAPSTSASATATASTPAAATTSAAPPPEPKHDCPTGSSGEGSTAKPCLASGDARMLEITSTGKPDENGAPMFNVKSKTTLAILYGKLSVYFYDKAGKQIGQPKSCAGAIFGGVVKPGESFVVSFSCMKKEDVPADSKTIEVEAPTVGFADASEKKTDFYWSNPDLAPDARKKGGTKSK